MSGRAATMTGALPAPRPVARSHARRATLLAAVVVGALFVVCHPYAGIQGDAAIYVMRALADRDPGGLGRDLLVVDDGQMGFSLFPPILRGLVAAVGAPHAAMLVSALGSAAWLAALAHLASRLAEGRPAAGRLVLSMVAMVAVLPSGYGDHATMFFFAEATATPRPLAEAAVLVALAEMLASRPGRAGLALLAAALLHPIMAEAGFGVVVLVHLARLPLRRRLGVAAALCLGGLAALALGIAGVPVLDRLVQRPDPAWLALLRQHSPHLFPTCWGRDVVPPLLAQATTIVVAARRAPPPQRALYLAALATAALGLAVAAVFGDRLDVLAVLQAQTWRAWWLLAVLAGCALAFCVATLWPGRPRDRLVLVLLACAWFVQPSAWVAAALAVAILGLDAARDGALRRLHDRHVLAVGLVVASLAAAWALGPVLGFVAYVRGLSSDQPFPVLAALRNNLLSLPLCTLVAVWLVARPVPRRSRTGLLAFASALALVAAAACGWDERGAAQAYLESPQSPPGLAALAAGRKPEVFWVDDLSDAWFALGRPQYLSPQQGVGIVFSRPLAAEWRRRAEALVGLGLMPRNVFTPGRPAADDDRVHVTQAAVDAFCARPDAPGLVVAPLAAGTPLLRDVLVWHLPAPLFLGERFVSSDRERRLEDLGIVPCAPKTG